MVAAVLLCAQAMGPIAEQHRRDIVLRQGVGVPEVAA